MSAAHIGLYDKAIEILFRAVEADPYNNALYEQILRLQIGKGKYEDAIETVKKPKSISAT